MDKSQQYQDQVKNKEAVVMIGMTGAGKSLTINFLKGLKIIEVKNLGKPIILDVAEEDKHKAAEVGHSTVSQTEFLNVQQVLYDLMVLDTAGFADNRGSEIEISQMITLALALNQAKSVKIVLVIEYAAFINQRGSSLKEILHIVSKLFNNLDILYPSMITIVTKSPQDVNHKGIVEILEDLNQNAFPEDIIMKNLVQMMINQFDQRKSRLIRPLLDNPKDYINLIKDLSRMDNPSQYLNFSLSINTKNKLELVVEKFSGDITKCLEDKNLDQFENLLKQLYFLQKTQQEFVIKKYHEIQNKIIETHQKQYLELLTCIEKEFRNQIISEYSLQKLLDFSDFIQNLNNKISGFIDQFPLTSESIKKQLNKSIIIESKNLINNYEDELNQKSLDYLEKYQEINKRSIYTLQSAQLVQQYFFKDNNIINQEINLIGTKITKRFQEFIKQLENFIKQIFIIKEDQFINNDQMEIENNNQLTLVPRNMNLLKEYNISIKKSTKFKLQKLQTQLIIIKKIEQFVISQGLQELNWQKSESLEQYIKQECTELLECIRNQFQREQININTLSQQMELLEIVIDDTLILTIFPQINNDYNQFLQKLTKDIKLEIEKISRSILDNIKENIEDICHIQLKQWLNQIIQLLEISKNIKDNVQDSLNNFIEQIKEESKYFYQYVNQLQNLNEFKKMSQDKMRKIKRQICILEQFGWLDEILKTQIIGQRIKRIGQNLRETLENYLEQLGDLYKEQIEDVDQLNPELIELNRFCENFIDVFNDVFHNSQQDDLKKKYSDNLYKLKNQLQSQIFKDIQFSFNQWNGQKNKLLEFKVNWSQIFNKYGQLCKYQKFKQELKLEFEELISVNQQKNIDLQQNKQNNEQELNFQNSFKVEKFIQNFPQIFVELDIKLYEKWSKRFDFDFNLSSEQDEENIIQKSNQDSYYQIYDKIDQRYLNTFYLMKNNQFQIIFENLQNLQTFIDDGYPGIESNKKYIRQIFQNDIFNSEKVKQQIEDFIKQMISVYDNLKKEELKIHESLPFRDQLKELQNFWQKFFSFENFKYDYLPEEKANDIVKTIKKCIRTNNYRNVMENIKFLKDPNFSQQLRNVEQLLGDALHKIIDYIQDLIQRSNKNLASDSQTQEELWQDIFKNVENMIKIKKLSETINSNIFDQEIIQNLKKIIKKSLENLIDNITELKNLFQKFDLIKYEKLYIKISKNIKNVKKFILDLNIDQKDFEQQFNDTENNPEFKKLIERDYSLYQIINEQNIIKINHVISQLEILSEESKQQDFFQKKLDELQLKIKDYFYDRFNNIKSQNNFEQQKLQYDILKKNLNQLQIYFKDDLIKQIQQFEEDLSKNIKKKENQILTIINSQGDLDELIALLKDLKDNNKKNYQYQINQFTKQLEECHKFLHQQQISLDFQKLEEIQQNFQKFNYFERIQLNIQETELNKYLSQSQKNQVQDAVWKKILYYFKEIDLIIHNKQLLFDVFDQSKQITDQKFQYLENDTVKIIFTSINLREYLENSKSIDLGKKIIQTFNKIIELLQILLAEYAHGFRDRYQDIHKLPKKIDKFQQLVNQLSDQDNYKIIKYQKVVDRMQDEKSSDEQIRKLIKNLQETAIKMPSYQQYDSDLKKLLHSKAKNVRQFLDEKNIKEFFDNLTDYSILSKDCNDDQKIEFQKNMEELNSYFSQMSEDAINKLKQYDYKSANEAIQILKNLENLWRKNSNNLEIQVVKIQHFYNNIYEEFLKEIRQIEDDIMKILSINQENQVLMVCNKLIQIQMIYFDAPSLEKEVREKIKQIVSQIKQQKKEIIKDIALAIKQGQDFKIGAEIINTCKEFQQITREDYKKIINQKSFQEIIKDFRKKINDQYLLVNSSKLQNKFNCFKRNYTSNIDKFFKGNSNNLKEKLKNELKISTKQVNLKCINNKTLDYLLDVLVKVTSIWSILDLEETEGNKNSYMEPNNAQIIAILILLNIDGEESGSFYIKKQPKGFKNQIIQVLTGEGKSIIIGFLSSIFALIGYEVHSVCYSSYLSERDYKSFEKLFQFLEIDDFIFYGTFHQISELILQKKINIRQKAIDLIQSNYQLAELDQEIERRRNKNRNRESVLIIDEVDVFFSETFYGKTFNPIVSYTSDNIGKLLKIVYEKGILYYQQNKLFEKDFYQELSETEVYKQLIEEHKKWEKIYEHNLFLMVQSIKEFLDQEHKYYFDPETKQIGYKQTDHTISYKINYGYLTVFSYIKENQMGNLSTLELEKKLSIPIKCGYLSYAETPKKEYYERILGVTGTLESLHPELLQELKNYDINQLTFTPSIFGKSNISFQSQNQEYMSVEFTRSDWNMKILGLIRNKFENEQPILVFFKDSQTINKFQDEVQFDPAMKDQIQVIDESTIYKDHAIKTSTFSQKISLITREFGRGTDFISNDTTVKANGGVVVIQTFLSIDYSEEVQIRGRTARQGQSGSYHLFVCSEDLEIEFSIPNNLDEYQQKMNQGGIYEYLHKIRNEKFGLKNQNYKQFILLAKQKHDKTIEFIKRLQEGQIQQASEELLLLNQGDKRLMGRMNSKPNHFILVIDDSGSMREQDGTDKTRWQQLMESCRKLIQGANDKDIVSAIFYSSNARIIINQEPIKKSIKKIQDAKMSGGGTEFFKGIDKIYDVIDQTKQEYQQFPNIIVFLSDGEDNENSKNKRNKSLEKLFGNFKDKISSFITLGQGPQANQESFQDMIKIAQKYDIKSSNSMAVNQEQLEEEFIKISQWEPLAIL